MAKPNLIRSGSNNPMYKHGEAGERTPEYRVWRGMIQRCHSNTCKDYSKYGERGIIVCSRWRKSYSTFLADMGRKPDGKHSIDRIDNDGPYAPENCRWATHTQQNRNRSSNRNLTHNGETKCLEDWAASVGILACTISKRLESGWSVDDALTIKTKARFKKGTVIEHDGLSMNLKDWSRHLGINYQTLMGRYYRGWPIHKLLSRP